ncbi:MAG: flagellar basal-body rod protein FlgB [Cycloclasticus sp. symbiont of Bathymodiolus heckerae]|nr:MAG: flagellar basal-body rod protein FlgB [Cycloclasticus sp. symbiont of Bathymodiolus heckerae]
MATTIDTLFGVHEQALIFRSKRAEVLASNMANADTPGYKARDFDFKSLLNNLSTSAGHVNQTHSRHISFDKTPASVALAYRIPISASLDGNTVDTQVEQASYAQNAMDYQTSLRFLNGKISGYLSALRGE